jgi:hypothetical protein
MSFQDIVSGLSQILGIDLVIDSNKAVKLLLDNKVQMQLEFHSFNDSYCIICPIEQLFQGGRREEILKAALKSNHMFRAYGGHFGFVEKKGFLLLFAYVHQSIANPESVFQQMVELSKQARSWIEALESGQSHPVGAFDEIKGPALPLFHHFKR